MRAITIKIDDEGRIEVWEGDLTSGQLSWDEMLGQVAELTHPRLCSAHYPMKTVEEWEARWKPLGAKADEKQGEINVNAGDSQAGT